MNAVLKESAPYIRRAAPDPPYLEGEPFFETDPVWDEIYPRIQSLEAFHTFFHQRHILNLMEIVTDAPAFVYPMKMARISTPKKIGYETPPHQDAHSHHAGPTMAGFWVSLHDVNEAMGRLKVLPKSHTRGVRPVFSTQGVGGVQCEIYQDETTWHVSDVEAGDVLIFHSCTVHKAEPNTTSDTVRISVDTRFCDHGAAVFSTNVDPHHGWRIEGLDWASIYSGWESTAIPILLARLSRSILVAGLPQTEQSRGGPNCEKHYCRAARCRCTLLANSHSLSWPHSASSCFPLSSSRRKLGTPQRPDAYIARRLFQALLPSQAALLIALPRSSLARPSPPSF